MSNNSYSSRGAITFGCDVRIGVQCLIFSIVAGSPAKVLKYRFVQENIKKIQNSKCWDGIESTNHFEYKGLLTNIINEND